jgi:hypothetical protein
MKPWSRWRDKPARRHGPHRSRAVVICAAVVIVAGGCATSRGHPGRKTSSSPAPIASESTATVAPSRTTGAAPIKAATPAKAPTRATHSAPRARPQACPDLPRSQYLDSIRHRGPYCFAEAPLAVIVDNEGPDVDYQVFYKTNRPLPLNHLADIVFYLNGLTDNDGHAITSAPDNVCYESQLYQTVGVAPRHYEVGDLARISIGIDLAGRRGGGLNATVPFRRELPDTFVEGADYFNAIGCPSH